MARASDNLFPSVLFVEGSAPASPASGDQRVFIDVADHKLKRKNSSGTVTDIEAGGGGGMTDPETTAGDMIIHNASNVLARLPVGSVGQVLGVAGGTPIPTYQNGGMVQLATQTLGSPAATLDFSSISGIYSALRLIAMGRISEVAAEDWINLSFNGDSGTNYDSDFYTASSSTITGSGLEASATAHVGDFPGTTAPANYPGLIIIDIPFYAQTTFNKLALAQSWQKYGAGLGNQPLRSFGIQWRSTTAITQVTLTPGGGNFITGSLAALYGLV